MHPRSAQLGFRRLLAADVDAFHGLCVNEHVRRYLLDGQVVSREWAAEEVARSDRLFEARGVGLWLIEHEGELAGFCGYRVFEETFGEPQLIYAFSEPFTARGLATEAAQALVQLAREREWPRIVAAVDEPNAASARVLEKVGFARCGRVPGLFGDVILFERFEAAAPVRVPMTEGARCRLAVDSTWDGQLAAEEEVMQVDIEATPLELIVRVEAPFFDDPPPPAAPGPTPQLWEHEAVELMLLGAGDRYLELELGPHGHFLVLVLHGPRNVVHQGLKLHYRVRRFGARWRGEALVPQGWLPADCERVNAYALHGVGAERRYLSWRPTGGERPDFHRLDAFGRFLP